MKETIALRLSESGRPRPDLILVDGGKAQLAAASEAVNVVAMDGTAIASAVKPQGKHSEISHFLGQQGNRIDFDLTSAAHRVLRLLRDDAHELANRVHRELRDMSHFYELASILPSINEAQRRRLLASFGSIKKIAEADVQTFSKMFGSGTAEVIMRDLAKYKLGENSTVNTFIVPIRFDAENGDAEDLRPIGP